MSRAETITATLAEAFAPTLLSVTDESARHAGHAGVAQSGSGPAGETHFDVTIVSAQFTGLSRVERQRRIHAALAGEFASGLHALSLKALTPEEHVSAAESRAAR
jgi:BolA protein